MEFFRRIFKAEPAYTRLERFVRKIDAASAEKAPNKDRAMAKIKDLTLLSDIFPTGYHGAYTAGVTTGSIAYVAGAGPVGLACAASCHLLGAAVVMVGDMIPERLAQAKSFGCVPIDLKKDASLADLAIQGAPLRIHYGNRIRNRFGSILHQPVLRCAEFARFGNFTLLELCSEH